MKLKISCTSFDINIETILLITFFLNKEPKKGKLKCESCASLFDIESLGSGKLDEEELDYNNRAHSAKLRVIEKL